MRLRRASLLRRESAPERSRRRRGQLSLRVISCNRVPGGAAVVPTQPAMALRDDQLHLRLREALPRASEADRETEIALRRTMPRLDVDASQRLCHLLRQRAPLAPLA